MRRCSPLSARLPPSCCLPSLPLPARPPARPPAPRSYWPGLEKRARGRPAARLYRLLTLADPVLDPITRGLFRMVRAHLLPGDWMVPR